ncbi:hypothetical protein N7490_009524 [Penicillium lividum]|nr:hypothetical protein N7490_009524 [Penicillium lividum]
MVTGIEAAGLALAIVPLFVNQIDGYVRGLKTQYAILLNTLEHALEGVVNDEDKVSELIRDANGDGWKDEDLQRRLRLKLDRNYDVFSDNVTGLSERLERLSHKLEIGITDMKTPVTEAWNIWKLRKILDRPVYDDLLAKISDINTILKTLIDQSDYREDTNQRRNTRHYLLKRYQKARKHAEGLFKAVTGGTYRRCQCKDHHCVHLQLQTNPLKSCEESSNRNVDTGTQFRMVFSNTHEEDTTCLWTWTEVVFETWQVEDVLKLSSLSLHDDFRITRHNPSVQFDIPLEKEKLLIISKDAPPIQDFCTSLCVAGSHVIHRECNELDTSVKYTMHAVKILPKPVARKYYHISVGKNVFILLLA